MVNVSPPPSGNVSPSCGDKICNGGETCNTCAGDCGSCPVANASNTCVDSDGGANYDASGAITGSFWNVTTSNMTAFNLADYCSGSWLIERLCSGTNRNLTTFNCVNGCNGGRC
ncbi:MAG: hypothetical protein AAB393_11460, partial [Bacteroidota bacterium]